MDVPNYEHIEDAYKGVEHIIDALPKSNLTERAKANLDIARDLTYRAREGARPERTEAVPGLGLEVRGPSMAGWPFRLQLSDSTPRGDTSC